MVSAPASGWAVVSDALVSWRARGARDFLRRAARFYLRGEERYYLTWDDFVGPSTLPLESGDVQFRLAGPEDLDALAAFAPHPRPRLQAWLGRGYLAALALKGGEAVGYYSFMTRPPQRVRPAIRLRPDELFAVEIYTVPSLRRQGITRRFRIAIARMLRERGYRGTWGLQAPLNYLAVDAADRLPALTRRTGTLTRRCLLGRVGFDFDPAAPLSAPRVASSVELLRAVLGPAARRIAIVLSPGSVILHPGCVEETLAAHAALGVQLRIVPVRESVDQARAFAVAFEALRHDPPDGLIVLHDPMFVQHRGTVLQEATALGVPALYEGEGFAAAGGLLACTVPAGVVPSAVRRATLPSNGGPRLVVNLAAARRLNLTIPPAVLSRARQVIE